MEVVRAQKVEPPRWQELIRDWRDFLIVAERSPKTVRLYTRTFVNMLADTLLDPFEVTRRDLNHYVASFDPRGAQRNNVIKAARSFYSWAEEEGYEAIPTKGVHTKRPKYGEAPYLEEGEMIRLFLAAYSREPRRAYGVAFAYCTGARLESLVNVRLEDLRDLDSNPRVFFRVAKGEKPYTLPLGPLGVYVVGELLQLMTPGQDTLLGVKGGMFWKWVSQAGEDSGIHAWPHLLRHTFGTELPENIDPRVWMTLMNHSDLSQYGRYRHSKEGPERQAMAVF